MISIILAAIALYVAFAKRISLWSSFEIRRPKTYYWAVIMLISVIASEIVSRNYNVYSAIGYIIAIVIPIIALFLFKEKKLENPEVLKPTNQKSLSRVEKIVLTINTVLWGAIYVRAIAPTNEWFGGLAEALFLMYVTPVVLFGWVINFLIRKKFKWAGIFFAALILFLIYLVFPG